MMRGALIVGLLLVGSVVAADPTQDAEAAYQEGRKLYDLREFDKAIAKFKEAYSLHPDERSLYNIAQSYRLKGDCKEAVGFYKTFKRNYPDKQVEQVDKFITDLQPCADKAAANPNPNPNPDPKPNPNPNPNPPNGSLTPVPETPHGNSRKKIGIAVAATGGVLVVSGFVFGALAKGKSSDVTDAGNPDMPPVFDPADAENSGKRFDLMAKITWGVGGAAVIGGVVLILTGKSSESRVSVTPSNGGAMFAWGHAL